MNRDQDWARVALDKAKCRFTREHNGRTPDWYELFSLAAKALRRAQAREREAWRKKIKQLSAGISKSFINCDEISAYRLACEGILAAMKRRKG